MGSKDGAPPQTVVQRSDCPFLKPSNLPENVLHIPLPPLSGSFSAHFSFQYLFVCRCTFICTPYQKGGYRLDTHSEGRKRNAKNALLSKELGRKEETYFDALMFFRTASVSGDSSIPRTEESILRQRSYIASASVCLPIS